MALLEQRGLSCINSAQLTQCCRCTLQLSQLHDSEIHCHNDTSHAHVHDQRSKRSAWSFLCSSPAGDRPGCKTNKVDFCRVKTSVGFSCSSDVTLCNNQALKHEPHCSSWPPSLWDTIACIIPQECTFFALYALCTITLLTRGCSCIDSIQ